MAAIPNFTDGQVVHQADLRFLLSPPEVVSGSTPAQSLANATAAAVQFSAPSEDTDTMWALGQPTRFTVVTPGLWLVNAQVDFAAGAASTRWVYVTKNGAGAYAQTRLTSGTDYMSVPTGGTQIRCSAGDYLELWAFQGSGASLAVNSARFHARFVNP